MRQRECIKESQRPHTHTHSYTMPDTSAQTVLSSHTQRRARTWAHKTLVCLSLVSSTLSSIAHLSLAQPRQTRSHTTLLPAPFHSPRNIVTGAEDEANLSSKDSYGATPLHWAVWMGFKDVAEVCPFFRSVY